MHFDIEPPRGFSFNLVGGPAFDTDVARKKSGREKRNQNRPSPIREYEISWPPRLQPRYEKLIDFFEAVAQGKVNSFLILDPFDHAVTRAQGVLELTDDSPSISYQAIKRRTYAGQTADRTIQKLRPNTVTVYEADGSVLNSGVDIDESTGIIDITTGTGPYTWAGQFFTPVRFDTDPMKSILLTKGRGGQYMFAWRNIPLIEVLLDL